MGIPSVAAFAADEFIPISYTLDIYTNTKNNVYSVPPNALPPNWVSGIDSQNYTYIAMANTQSRRRNQPGTYTVNQWGEGKYIYRVSTDRQVQTTMNLKINQVMNGEVDSSGYFPGVTTSAQAIVDFAKTPVVVTSGESTENVEKTSGPSRAFMTFKNLTWTSLGPEVKIANIIITMKKLTGNVSIFVPSGSGSNAVAAVAQASCLHKFKVDSLSFPTIGNAAVIGTYNGYGPGGINYELRNKNNGLIGSAFSQVMDMTTETSPHEFEIYPNNDDLSNLNRNPLLKLIFQKDSSLRKAFSFNYDQNIGVSGVQIDLKYGDFDGDNEVEAEEVNLIPTYYGLTENDLAFNSNVPGTNFLVSDLDINKDGIISSADYLLVLPNIGLIGD